MRDETDIQKLYKALSAMVELYDQMMSKLNLGASSLDAKKLLDYGYAVVPLEPTEDMEVAATEAWMREEAAEDRAHQIYKAMIEAGKVK